MSSSDSEDDCYGNIAQKLQNIKSKYEDTKIESVVVKDTVEIIGSSKTLSKLDENTSTITIDDCNITVNSTDNDELTLDAIIAENSKKKPGRGRGRKRKSSGDAVAPSKRVTRSSRRKTANSNEGRTSPVTDTVPTPAPIEQITSTASNRSNARGRASGGRNRGSVGSTRGRARGRRGGARGRRDRQSHSYYPTYSVGNTDEYPDQCDNLELFAPTKPGNDVELVEEIDPLDDDNEEMSVKVYWQSLEIFKFKIRKYQKLTQVFQYFAEKEGVSNDKLLFTYNDKILKIDDTPESIDYSIAKFIDGGIVNQNVTELVTRKNKGKTDNNGLKVKFQCQNLKNPFETTLRPEDKLGLAMTKCAEHIEIPIEKLKFYFDGDLLSSKITPLELDFESGECIDVKICS